MLDSVWNPLASRALLLLCRFPSLSLPVLCSSGFLLPLCSGGRGQDSGVPAEERAALSSPHSGAGCTVLSRRFCNKQAHTSYL